MSWLFWAAAAILLYTYFGYPALLWMRVRLAPRPVLRASKLPSISIVMVVRNEAQVLEQKLHNLLHLNYPPEHCQIIVVSDGSTDGTEQILSQYSANPRVCSVLNNLSRGKASGLNDAMLTATGEIAVFTDARQELEPDSVQLMMENFADPDVGCVSGALMLGDAKSGEASSGMGMYWRVEKRVRELESECGSVVGATGAIYAVRRNLLTVVPEGTILDDLYIPMQVVRKGKRVVFDSRARAWDSPDLGSEREFGRKVRTLTGNYQLLQLAPWLLSGNNPLRFEFVSHKLLRLILPFVLAILLIGSIVLSGPVFRFALILQVSFYMLSLIAGLGLGSGPLVRLSDAALTFVILNSAAAVAFLNFVTGRKTVWVR